MTTVKPKGDAVESPVHWMKRLQVRNEVLAGADFALGQKLPPTQRLILESRRVNFVKNFDAIEECAGTRYSRR